MAVTISTDKTLLNLDLIVDFLSNHSYWAKGRSRKTIEKSIENSLCFGAYNEKGKQVGFARVVSDFAVFAWILDVFVLEEYRGNGIGKLLMDNIIGHPELQGLQRWGLGTKDAHELYKKYGFVKLKNLDLLMEIVNRPS